ncbi:MAG: CheR family methyltransferase [Oscillospiraceae bacterium]
MINITEKEFVDLSTFIKTNYGIDLTKKKVLIESRLANTLMQKGMKSFTEYIDLVKRDRNGEEITVLLNKLTTNHTYFLREQQHFNFLKTDVMPFIVNKNKFTKMIRIWSAGCSTGQEAYTIAMTINEFFGGLATTWKVYITATDISENVLAKGRAAIYTKEELKDIPPQWIKKYFTDLNNGSFKLNDLIKNQVTFQKANLMQPFTMRPFDIIFCRNVMIYYDAPTKDKLVQKFYEQTAPGGFFFIGLSESINRQTVKYKYLKPAIFQREG